MSDGTWSLMLKTKYKLNVNIVTMGHICMQQHQASAILTFDVIHRWHGTNTRIHIYLQQSLFCWSFFVFVCRFLYVFGLIVGACVPAMLLQFWSETVTFGMYGQFSQGKKHLSSVNLESYTNSSEKPSFRWLALEFVAIAAATAAADTKVPAAAAAAWCAWCC